MFTPHTVNTKATRDARRAAPMATLLTRSIGRNSCGHTAMFGFGPDVLGRPRHAPANGIVAMTMLHEEFSELANSPRAAVGGVLGVAATALELSTLECVARGLWEAALLAVGGIKQLAAAGIKQLAAAGNKLLAAAGDDKMAGQSNRSPDPDGVLPTRRTLTHSGVPAKLAEEPPFTGAPFAAPGSPALSGSGGEGSPPSSGHHLWAAAQLAAAGIKQLAAAGIKQLAAAGNKLLAAAGDDKMAGHRSHDEVLPTRRTLTHSGVPAKLAEEPPFTGAPFAAPGSPALSGSGGEGSPPSSGHRLWAAAELAAAGVKTCPVRNKVRSGPADPALRLRQAARERHPHTSFVDDTATLRAGLVAQRRPPPKRSGGQSRLDHHLPPKRRLEPCMWELAGRLPSKEAISAMDEDELYDYQHFINLVLPRAGAMQSIRCGDPDVVYDPLASAAERKAALISLGWSDGRLPSAKKLKLHMLERIEYEYAEHLFLDHGTAPGQWCEECVCTCAPAVDPRALAHLMSDCPVGGPLLDGPSTDDSGEDDEFIGMEADDDVAAFFGDL